jgi:hypoxanthine-DNA glycosylase
LWDVLHSCHRKGSLDAAIQNGSVKVNNFDAFFRRYPGIGIVLFNGATSERYYKRYVLPGVQNGRIIHIRMPSTSPAHAAMSLKQKIKMWCSGIDAAQQTAARDRVSRLKHANTPPHAG